MKVALYGGSFNPITLGHVEVALYVLNSGLVDQVWLVPSYRSCTGKKLANENDRLEMCKLATEKYEKIIVSDFEIKNKIVGTTAVFLEEFYKYYNKDKYYFVIGMDNAVGMENWKDYQKILKMIPFIVVPRIGYSNLENCWYHKDPHIFIENSFPIPRKISSTLIRKYIEDKKIYEDVDEKVTNHINSKNLYL